MKPITWNCEPISAPGIYRAVPIDLYHQQLTVGPSVSSSGLRTIFHESPAHYFVDSYLNPHRTEQKVSEAFIFGRAAHHLLLGEADFSKYFVVRPAKVNGADWNSNRTDCKEWLKAMAAERLTVLTQGQIEAIRGMAGGLAAHPLVRAGVLNGLVEHSIVWQDEETGIWLKIRPDSIPTDSDDPSDLKSAADVTDAGIEETIGGRGYNMQGGLVAMGWRAVFKREINSFNLVFSEKTEPHVARVVTLKPADLELGERQVRASLRQFARCIETGHWPGPGGDQSDAAYVEMKPYHRTRIEHRLAVLEMEPA